jgi:hypothetical protein
MPDRAEHRGVAFGAAAETVRGGLARIVGFGFDDAAADAVHEQTDADEIARDFERAAVEEIGRERRRRSLDRPLLTGAGTPSGWQ